jgi:hypothetical protein
MNSLNQLLFEIKQYLNIYSLAEAALNDEIEEVGNTDEGTQDIKAAAKEAKKPPKIKSAKRVGKWNKTA